MEQQPKYQYDVCFSFASEQVSYVEQVYQSLQALNVKVFFDRAADIEAELWGENLIELFDKVFKKLSQYCVMFISEEYKKKAWTQLERRSALERALTENAVYILPVRFDQTELPGFHSTVNYINASKKTPEELAALIVKKLGKQVCPPKEPDLSATLERLADKLRGTFSKEYTQYIVQVNQAGQILIFRNEADRQEAIYAAVIELVPGAEKPATLFNFGIFPPVGMTTQWTTDELTQKFREVFSQNGNNGSNGSSGT